MSAIELKRARARKIPSGVEIISPEHSAVRLRLPTNATPLDFLKAVYQCKRLPMELRIEAAQSALPFVHPRLIAVVPGNVGPQRLEIVGGLPRLRGCSTVMPIEPPPMPSELAVEPEPETAV
jgi:hypothetical protein